MAEETNRVGMHKLWVTFCESCPATVMIPGEWDPQKVDRKLYSMGWRGKFTSNNCLCPDCDAKARIRERKSIRESERFRAELHELLRCCRSRTLAGRRD